MKDDRAAARDAAKLATKIARHLGCKCGPVKPGEGEFAPFSDPDCPAQAVAMDGVRAVHEALREWVEFADQPESLGRMQ